MSPVQLIAGLWLTITPIALAAQPNHFPTKKQQRQKMKRDLDVQVEKYSAYTQKVSFIVGPGASFITSRLWEKPFVNPVNGFVFADKASRIKTNIALGVIYTQKTYNMSFTPMSLDSLSGEIVRKRVLQTIAKGRTYAIFINPVSFSSLTQEQSFFSMPDFGVGYGHKGAGGIVILLTCEFFYVRQPRQWFFDSYIGKNTPYQVNNQTQFVIQETDDNLFRKKLIPTIGFKVCYTFDVIKSFVSSSKEITGK